MTNMLIDALEEAFDSYFEERYPNSELNNPKTLQRYKMELKHFSDFLVKLYDEDRVDALYWEERFKE